MKKDEVIELKSIEYDFETFDLNKISPYFKDKKIIAIGEATHGTSDHFKMKHRLLRYLVEGLGIRLFLMECTFGNALKTNEYVMYGKGTALEALKNIKGNGYQYTEVLDLLTWMRSYNENKPQKEKVQFWGFDMIYSEASTEAILAFFKQNDPDFYHKADSLLIDFKADKLHRTGSGFISDQIQIWINQLIEVKNHFINHLSIYQAKTSNQEIEIVKQYFTILEQLIVIDAVQNREPMRDEFMAKNVDWILNHHGNDARCMLWAHNFHISKSIVKQDTMGWHLYNNYKEKYYAIGQEFNEGTLYAPTQTTDYQIHKIPPAHENSFANYLSRLNLPILFFDLLEGSKNETIKQLLENRHDIHLIGVWYGGENASYENISLQEHFDALIFHNVVKGAEKV